MKRNIYATDCLLSCWYLLCYCLYIDCPISLYSWNERIPVILSLMSFVPDESLLWHFPLLFYCCCLLIHFQWRIFWLVCLFMSCKTFWHPCASFFSEKFCSVSPHYWHIVPNTFALSRSSGINWVEQIWTMTMHTV